MQIASIICEYNPFHNGHKYQIEKTKELTGCDGIICIMSGNFVQRGEPAIIDKWNRTLMALRAGADLVIELPALFSLSSAEFFADSAVKILNSLGVVDYLSFGSENGNVALIKEIAEILLSEPSQLKEDLKLNIRAGNDFPSARAIALKSYLAQHNKLNLTDIINTPNNILSIEYCKALLKYESPISPFTIKRLGGGYNSSELDDIFSSASAIRNSLQSNTSIDMLSQHLPSSTISILKVLEDQHYPFIFSDDMFKYLKYKFITDQSDNILSLIDCNHEIKNRMQNCIANSHSLDEFIKKIKSKGYTYSRISRILTQYFIGIERYDVRSILSSPIEYIRVLGLNSTGADILKKIKSNSSINIYTKLPKKNLTPMLEIDIKSTNAYSILNNKLSFNHDYLKSPIVL